MSLDKELTAAFGQEAEMREIPLPDVEALIRGGRARRRRRNMGRIGVAAAAAVLVGGGAYGVAHVDPGDPGTVTAPPAASESEPDEPAAVPPSFQHLNHTAIEPGTYRMFVGADPAGAKIEADLTVTGPNWTSGDEPVVSEGDTWAGVGVYQPDALAGVAPCSGHWQSRDASGTPQALARQLVRLPRSTVVQPLTPTEAFGHDAIHLRLRIDDQCPRGEYYQIAQMPAGSRGITYGHPSKEVLIDFWVVDRDGTTVVVDMWHQVDASTELVGRATQVRDSINFVTGE
ncbi:MAG: hypothetical protein ACRDPJ_07925 [Nocardioidaceae bacterium]